MSLAPGLLVVCVDDRNWLNPYSISAHPVKGRVYTIRTIDPDRGGMVRLEEIINPPEDHGWGFFEGRFLASRFRPVDDTKLEVFRKIAASPKDRIRVGEEA